MRLFAGLVFVAISGIGRVVTGWIFGNGKARRRKASPPTPETRTRRVTELWVAPLVVALLAAGVTIWFDERRSERERIEAKDRAQEEADQAARQFLLDRLKEPDLSGVDLSGEDLSGLQLVDKTLVDAILVETDLRNSTVRQSDISRANLQNSNLTNARIVDVAGTQVNAQGVDASAAYIQDAVLDGSLIEKIDLARAELHFVSAANVQGSNIDASELFALNLSLRGASLTQSDLRGAVLLGVDFFGADLTGSNLSGSVLFSSFATEARSPDLQRPTLTQRDVARAFGMSESELDAVLRAAALSRADLQDLRPDEFVTDFARSALRQGISYSGIDPFMLVELAGYRRSEFTTGPLFEQVILREASLDDVDLSDSSFVVVDLTEASISGADLSGSRILQSGLAGVDFNAAATLDALRLEDSKAQLSGWRDGAYRGLVVANTAMDFSDLAGAKFESVSFKGVSLRGADLRGAVFNDSEFSDVDLDGACIDDATRLPDNVDVSAAKRDCPPESAETGDDYVGSAPGGKGGCAEGGCIPLQVANTIVDGQDFGVYVRFCPDDIADCPERMALAAFADIVWAECRVLDGLFIDGSSTWVRVRWNAVPGSMPADGLVDSEATGYSSPDAPDVGWISSVYLSPTVSIDELTRCSD